MIASLTDSGEAHAAGYPPEAAGDLDPGRSYFARRAEPFGAASIDLEIGPLRMRLEGLSERQVLELGTRFRPFARESAGKAHLVIEVGRAGVEAFLRVRSGGEPETYRLESRASGQRIELWSYEFAGWVAPAARRARLDLVRPEGALFDRGLENFLRVMTASFVLERGGFLLHGSGVVRGGKAHVFFGPSGSGKTTVTRLSPGDTILSDDLTLVVPREDGGYAAAGIPFGMAHHCVPHTSGSFPIASFNRLIQSRRVRREPLGRALAVAEVASSLPFVMQETRQAARALETVERALDTIPAYRLHFRKDDSFWAVVEGARPG